MSVANSAVVRRLISEWQESGRLAQCRSLDEVKQNPGISFSRLHLDDRLSREEVGPAGYAQHEQFW